MLAAITYESMIKSMTESPLQQNMIGILLARPTSKSGKDICPDMGPIGVELIPMNKMLL